MGSRRIHWGRYWRLSRSRPRWGGRHSCILSMVLLSLLASLPPTISAILLSAVLSCNGPTHVPTVLDAMGPNAGLRILVDIAPRFVQGLGHLPENSLSPR
jgi:hypothetical protein